MQRGCECTSVPASSSASSDEHSHAIAAPVTSGGAPRMVARFVSFGFEYGTPVDADLVLAADGGVAGGVHVPWKLSSKKGDEVHLLNPAGAEIDSTTFGLDVAADKSWGRLPDGTGAFLRTTPTMGKANF